MSTKGPNKIYAQRFVHHALKTKVKAEDIRAAHASFVDLKDGCRDDLELATEIIRALRLAVGGEDTKTRAKAAEALAAIQVELDL
jgi:hypothetical protein